MVKHRFPHDASYKTLFSDPAIVESLLRDFIPEDFINDLDFAKLEQAPGEYITEDFQERHGDTIWRLRWKDTWCYIFLLIEFQSSQHYWMALRMLTYTALLWENLVKIGYLKAKDKLPPVFPIVLYNGDSPWKAETDISNLVTQIAPALDAYQPKCKYYVLDEKRIARERLDKAKGAAGYIIKVEQAENREQIFRLAVDFDSQDGLTKAEATQLAMLEWMDKKIKHLPVTLQQGNLSTAKEETMLAELIEKYKRPYINEGIAKGQAEGMICLIKERLTEKFGTVPAKWELAIGKLTDTTQLLETYRKLSKATTPIEVDEVLKNWS